MFDSPFSRSPYAAAMQIAGERPRDIQFDRVQAEAGKREFFYNLTRASWKPRCCHAFPGVIARRISCQSCK